MNEETVLRLRRSGKGYNEICKLTGLTKNEVGYICRRNGLGGFVAGSFPLTEEQAAAIVNQSGFDYVSGYNATKKPIVVRCRQCGRTFERQFHIFRDVVNGTWQCGNECPLCRSDRLKAEQEQRETVRKAEREREAQKRTQHKAERLSRTVGDELTKRLAIHVCKNCGKEFCQMVTGYNSQLYCSEACQKRWFCRKANEKRYRKLMTRRHDTDITLDKLFKRDKGICYLCGRNCDWTDGEQKNGTFIAGDNYPSVDHVIPVSKGGTHTWDNIRLACRRCNFMKSDT